MRGGLISWGLLLLLNLGPSLAGAETLKFAAEELQRLPWALNDSAFEITGDGELKLRLCECERAAGAPGGLSCDKTGWFVSNFERQGQWVSPFAMVGGGAVPLNHAVCCRPCLPAELPPDASGRIAPGQKPVAVLSMACHVSTSTPMSLCEAGGASLVAGYAESVHVLAAAETEFPVNAPRCCTPALLLESGDAWELERCGCGEAAYPGGDPDVSCGGTNTHKLLAGYANWRVTPALQSVPIAPAHCCGLCLSERFHPGSQCDDLGACHGHGVCNMGACDCAAGWVGPDCAARAERSGSKPVPGWAIALLVLSSLAIAGTLAMLAHQVLYVLGDNLDEAAGLTGPRGSGDDAREPLIIRLDPDDVGSVGSMDSESELSGDECEPVATRIRQAIQTLNPAAHSADGGDDESADGAVGNQDAGDHAPERVRDAGDSPGTDEHATGDDLETGGAGDDNAAHVAFPDAGAKPPVGGSGVPLSSRDCSVCMVRPTQVVLVPCGHICLCRRCSRRLQRCPICRKDIARRQRLFM